MYSIATVIPVKNPRLPPRPTATVTPNTMLNSFITWFSAVSMPSEMRIPSASAATPTISKSVSATAHNNPFNMDASTLARVFPMRPPPRRFVHGMSAASSRCQN